MARPSKSRSPLVGGLLHRARALARDERGTSLTEFIIVLPVFVILFIGIAHLSRLEREAFRVKARAAKTMWVEAMAAQEGGNFEVNPSHMMPQVSGAEAIDEISSYPSENGDMFGTIKNAGLLSQGSPGEAARANMMLDVASGQSPPSPVPGRNLSGRFAQHLLDERRSRTLGGASGPLGIYRPSQMFSRIPMMPNPTFSSGIRYGMVGGLEEHSFTINGIDYEMRAHYDVLISPVPREGMLGENLVIGASRLSAQRDRCLRNVLALDRRMGYMRNCR